MKKIIIILVCVIIALAGYIILKNDSGSVAANSNLPYSGVKLRIVKQYTTAYAPIYVAEKLNLIDKYLPGVEVEWVTISGGAAISEALISGQLDMGVMGIPPALIAADKGADFKIAMGLSVLPIDLMVNGDKIKSFSDFKPEDKIGVPGIGSNNHIAVSLMAKKFLGDAHAFDKNVVVMRNPDSYTSLISNSLTAHASIMAYSALEEKAGFKKLASSSDVIGDVSLVCVASKKLYEQPAVYAGVLAGLNEAITLINARDEKTIQIIADEEKLTVEQVKEYLSWDGTNYTSNIYGLMNIADYMYQEGYIKNKPVLENYVWNNVLGMIGKRMGGKSLVEKALGE